MANKKVAVPWVPSIPKANDVEIPWEAFDTCLGNLFVAELGAYFAIVTDVDMNSKQQKVYGGEWVWCLVRKSEVLGGASTAYDIYQRVDDSHVLSTEMDVDSSFDVGMTAGAYYLKQIFNKRKAPDSGYKLDGHNTMESAMGMCEEYIARHRGTLTGSYDERKAFEAGYKAGMKKKAWSFDWPALDNVVRCYRRGVGLDEYEINWSAIGAVSIEDARDFANRILDVCDNPEKFVVN